MLTIIILFFSIIFASALCSMSEAAILSLPMIRARVFADQKKPNSKDLLHIKENITQTIASIVIVNNAINIVGSIYVGQQIALRFGDQWLGVASAVLTFSIIIVSEIIPKMIGERYKGPLALFFAKPLRIFVWVFSPLVAVIIQVTQPLLKAKRLPRITEDEIKMMLKLGRAEGTVETDEEVLCSRVFKLNDVRAVQIMKPMEEIHALPADRTLEAMKDEILNSRFSRIAVYDKDPLDIVGTVQHSNLLREMANGNFQARIRDFMVPPIFVNSLMKADALLEKFQVYQQHLFIVQDSRGKHVGLVTMEDVLEELFGEIYDEKDVIRAKLDSGNFQTSIAQEENVS